MNTLFSCSLCPDQFPTLLKHVEHMNWHTAQEEKGSSRPLTPSKTELLGITKQPTPQEWMEKNASLIQQSGAFDRPRLDEVIEKEKKAAPAIEPPRPVAPPQPLSLVYKYEGECPDCRVGVETIEVILEGKNAITAYCYSCKKKLAQQLVIPIEKQ